MTKFQALLAGLAISVVAAGAAQATTLSGNICEGGAGFVSPVTCDHTLGDFNTSLSSPTLDIAPSATFYGAVRNDDGVSRFTDGFTVNLTSAAIATFNWSPRPSGSSADGVITMSGSGIGFTTAGTPAGGSIDLGSLSGTVTFSISPLEGSFPQPEVFDWSLELAAVPLPAGLPLLALGLGGLAMVRRRKS